MKLVLKLEDIFVGGSRRVLVKEVLFQLYDHKNLSIKSFYSDSTNAIQDKECLGKGTHSAVSKKGTTPARYIPFLWA